MNSITKTQTQLQGVGNPMRTRNWQLVQCKHILESLGQMNLEMQQHNSVAETAVGEK